MSGSMPLPVSETSHAIFAMVDVRLDGNPPVANSRDRSEAILEKIVDDMDHQNFDTQVGEIAVDANSQ